MDNPPLIGRWARRDGGPWIDCSRYQTIVEVKDYLKRISVE